LNSSGGENVPIHRQPPQRFLGFAIIAGILSSALSCSLPPSTASSDLPKPTLDLPAPGNNETTRTAVLAGGCFWCTEAVFRELKGVSDVVSGYAGGTKDTANYDEYMKSNHAEAIKITYDPRQVSYGELLRVLFTVADPTQPDGQGPDLGHQYRFAIFYENDDQKHVAEAYIKQLTDAHVFERPIVAAVEPLGEGFFRAEDYHQNYVADHPNQPYVQANSVPKLRKLREHFGDELKQPNTPTTAESRSGR
jgi:peptide-methionine (S)-S-oxide reductase